MRRGFTLVELLVVIAIIVTIASALMIAVYMAQQSANEAATIKRVRQLSDFIERKYAEFDTRPIPVPIESVCAAAGLDPSPSNPNQSRDLALARLLAKREMMRTEIPERFTDIVDPPVFINTNGTPFRSSMARYLHDRFTTLRKGRPLSELEQYESAECLYLAVSSDRLAMELFARREVGDADGDGLFEFHDAWGSPILFFRWAPGFTPYSEIQTAEVINGIAEPHDSLDWRLVDADAYQMFPLVYSPGPDGKAGLNFRNGFSYAPDNDPLASVTGDGGVIGAPLGEEHFDNIHSHSSLVE